MSFALVTPPASEPLSAAEVKARLNTLADVSDATVDAWISAERQRLDGPNGEIGRAIMTQTWDYTIAAPYVPRSDLPLPLPPLQAVLSVSYFDGAGTLQAIPTSEYRVVLADPGWIVFSGYRWGWPSPNGEAVVRFRCGYADANAVPLGIKEAIILRIAHKRSLTERDLFIRSETADGIGSTDYTVSSNAGDAIEAQVEGYLRGLRFAGIS